MRHFLVTSKVALANGGNVDVTSIISAEIFPNRKAYNECVVSELLKENKNLILNGQPTILFMYEISDIEMKAWSFGDAKINEFLEKNNIATK